MVVRTQPAEFAKHSVRVSSLTNDLENKELQLQTLTVSVGKAARLSDENVKPRTEAFDTDVHLKIFEII